MKKGFKHSEESKKRMSAAPREKKKSTETRRKMSEAHRGRPFSEEHKRKLRESHLGKSHSAATKERIGKASRGRKHSEEAKQRMKEAQRTRRGDPVKRFWSKVNKTAPGSCWTWTGYIGSRGYGHLGWKGHPAMRAHRVAYEITFGSIPKGMIIMHTCDNKKCVNPAHLSLGTQLDNIRDAVLKGRHPTGEQVSTSKLTEEQVIEIRRRAASGTSYWDLSRDYNVAYGTIGRIVKRESWRYIKEE